jgi:hypothetical protein
VLSRLLVWSRGWALADPRSGAQEDLKKVQREDLGMKAEAERISKEVAGLETNRGALGEKIKQQVCAESVYLFVL